MAPVRRTLGGTFSNNNNRGKVMRIGFSSVDVERLLASTRTTTRTAPSGSSVLPEPPRRLDGVASSSATSDVLLQHLLDFVDHALVLLDDAIGSSA